MVFNFPHAKRSGKPYLSIGETKLGLAENIPIGNLQVIVRKVQPEFNRSSLSRVKKDTNITFADRSQVNITRGGFR